MTRETVQLVNMVVKNLYDHKYDDEQVELIFDEIRAGRTTMNLEINETITISDKFSFVRTCEKCGYKSTDSSGDHDCQPATNDK